ncbi:urea ABC transporter ATP-binding protein [Rhodococcus ruber Chol-4]|uniref:Branched-chain amino acid ABC transporter ATPase n=3 Tax=Rhodococcus TaxID=1827 RepID=M2ZPG9_9NOCA|nr:MULTISPECIES: urea ABC transporter ATP-binding subunit UrtE [Rhodococcus]EME62254.1 branched-chain amino acid ABC transporter ATPase [Rhodococcus ruber BKS 20-38]KXF85367.1 urea ABC transporter ATP-binding protein [Rhodococcus ruber Chol-4]MBP2212881.1 urea transport system ATP-binding protein [Rhodococcus ruber]MCD2126732.1 urea ABC transporter ATP-binding subunit UrtE [Rhodococcus ruber]MCF8781556.1 urea ABC transporter ATP-binding subunit UrtE [Rhodococcus ruber]
MLELVDVRTGYGRTEIIHGATLTVPADGVVAVMGHNGAGKTTLLRAAVGLLPTTFGRILLDGEDITSLRPAARVARGLAYVPQGQQSFAQLTCAENLQVVADGRRRGKQLVADMLELFPALVPLLDRRAGLLSGGQRQQLAIARALITEPRMLILDEPTEGIQPSVVAEIESTVVELSRRGDLGVLLVEQHIGFALQAAQRYYVLESGRITASGDGGTDAAGTVRAAMAI